MPEKQAALAQDTEQEYRAIEQTLLGTARGRWFLAEHGRRSRRLDTVLLEDAIGRLSSSLSQPPPVLATLRTELEKLSEYINTTKSAMVAKSTAKSAASNSSQATGANAVAGANQAVAPVAQMLRMAEDIHELAWTLQADELSPENCEAIARHSSMLYAVSRQQAMESDRALQFAKALDDAASRMSILLDTLVHELNTYQDKVVPPPADDEYQRKAG